MWVKICGTTTVEDAMLAVDAGARAVGFVFAPSKRRVTAEEVQEITAQLPTAVERVGVFTSTNAQEIVDTARQAGLTAVQLHSAYAPDMVRTIVRLSRGALRVLQVVAVPVESSETSCRDLETQLNAIRGDDLVEMLLLDASVRGASGGRGVSFDWERVAPVLQHVWPADGRIQLGLAGGLHAQNVAEAVRAIRPDFVDVVSGVEAAPGRKSPERVNEFILCAIGR